MSLNRKEIPKFDHPIIETHCHLDYLKSASTSEIIALAKQSNVVKIITIAVSPENQQSVISLAEQHLDVWTTQGIHPHEADKMTAAIAAGIRKNLTHPKVVAVGECGLDYYYEHSDRQIQRNVFEQQLEMAAEHDLPVVIHTRDADDDTRDILRNFTGRLKRGGVIHSFTSSLALAEFCLQEGFCLGFNGICTFNKADNVRAIVTATPVDRILLETDAPYLTPVPLRGKENSPAYLPFIAQFIAHLKSIDVNSLLTHCFANSERVFFYRQGAGDAAIR